MYVYVSKSEAIPHILWCNIQRNSSVTISQANTYLVISILFILLNFSPPFLFSSPRALFFPVFSYFFSYFCFLAKWAAAILQLPLSVQPFFSNPSVEGKTTT